MTVVRGLLGRRWKGSDQLGSGNICRAAGQSRCLLGPASLLTHPLAHYPTRAQFFEAASVEGHAQALAFAALGRYFQEVEGKGEQSMRCYKRALALDPSVAVAGAGGARPAWVDSVLGEAQGAVPDGDRGMKAGGALRGEDSAGAAAGSRMAGSRSVAAA